MNKRVILFLKNKFNVIDKRNKIYENNYLRIWSRSIVSMIFIIRDIENLII